MAFNIKHLIKDFGICVITEVLGASHNPNPGIVSF